ncbi:GCN5-related N-acetyltransferase [Xenorhabdus bovienii str. Jollieti]|uniref:GCN5-related N-acetyltransferase n=1 Tax=Xenorhabdus bovienii (strain SS-2004) TaxID=406818 RepID=D3V8D9_XENBS|nr:GNAT family N-acetyltransferase [Xenorhabdus bovienii]CBJ82101.1 GCN5-related N-acetyltransferase [Xenorhabdus bovienii SS-2004]CDH27924.1 GCN5-related N-acetyltransferase [Xenorhabdus bovienii str. Jollieti]
MFFIRPTQILDAGVLPAIERSASQLFLSTPELAWIADGHTQTEQQHLDYILQQNSWVALNGDNQPVGFILAKPLDDGLHIMELSVHRDWQKKGIGKALIDTVIQVAEQRGFQAVTLTTFRHINWNAPFYRRLGFFILEPRQIAGALCQILQREIEYGFAENQRCAMKRLVVTTDYHD